MYRSLYFKIILIFVVFMITVMAVVGTVLLNSVFSYYLNEFTSQVSDNLAEGEQLRTELIGALEENTWVAAQKAILSAYSSYLGIDIYRSYYILDENGNCLAGSADENDKNVFMTPNIIKAMKGEDGTDQILGSDYTDCAVYLENNGRVSIIYIKDTQEEMRELSWRLFSIILQSVMFGLAIAILLSFFLAKAITQPIQRLTRGARLIASGQFTDVPGSDSKDEIGTLTSAFNYMNTVIKNTLGEIESERLKLETVFAYLKDGVIAFSDSGAVIQINKAAISLLGKNYDSSFNMKKLLELIYVELSQATVTIENGEKSYAIRDVEMEDKALDINIGVLRYVEQSKTHKGYIIVLHDITSRYELDKARREFVANVSHELRTPLTSIKGWTETIINTPDMDSETRTHFLKEYVLDESDRMLSIIMDLLTLSRLDNRRTQWCIEEFSIGSSLEHICRTMTVNAEQRGQRLTLSGSCPSDMITGDKKRIEQVIINVISNAIKYTPEGGKVAVKLGGDNANVNISIKDNGIGIPDEDIPHVFERFYRVEKSRTSETGGTGLGLSIANEIITAHGGSISLKSKVGEGSEFTIIIPVKTSLVSTEQ